MSDTSCIFCKIAAREAPAEILHESDRVVAFRDLDPKAPTHILLIPKQHIASIADVSDDDGRTWRPIEGAGYHTFSFARGGKAGWGAGERGTLGKLTW